MSHQSLNDLTNVTGSPSDGQILKYQSGSSSWAPADESGGGSSGAEYLEIFESGDSASLGGYCLHTGGGSKVIHNSIPSASVYKRADAPSATNFNTDWQASTYDDIFWIANSATDKYVIEITLLLNHSNSSYNAVVAQPKYQLSSNIQTAASNLTLFVNESSVSRVLSGYNATYTGITGKVEEYKTRFSFDASLISSATSAATLVIPSVHDYVSGDFIKIGGYYSSGLNTTVLRRHIRLTKIA